MRTRLLLIALALVLYGCGRQEPVNQAPVEATRPAEKASDEVKPLTDSSLTQIVKAALESESSLDPRRIQVENRNGIVALRGSVQSEEQKEKAARIVGSVGGVKSVENQLTVDETASTGATGQPPQLPR